MQRNIDCIRDIMVYADEYMKMDDFLDITRLQKNLEENDKVYSIEDITYSIVMLKESELARVRIQPAGGKEVYAGGIYRLTSKGHDYLDALRDDNIYNESKGIANKLGDKSLDTLFDIAKGLISKGIVNIISGM